MAAPTKVPNKTELRRYLSKGLTQQQIVDAWENDSGIRVSRSAIAMAIERNDLHSAHPRPDYSDMLPWVVSAEHRYHMDARMLRLEGRRRTGHRLNKREQKALQRWTEDLEEAGAVVHYERDTDEGFFWIPRQPIHGNDVVDRTNADKVDPTAPARAGTRGLAERRAARESTKPRGGTAGRAVADKRRD